MHRKLLVFSLLLPLFVSAVGKPSRTDDPAFGQIDGIITILSQITGLQEEHAVPYGRMNQAQLRKFLSHRIHATLKPKVLELDELTLKLFGLVPADFDLQKETIDLLAEQAAAFYDYREKKLFLLDGASVSSEETTLAHELSHALADQHFNLEKFVDDDSSNDDENLAHTAVVEGQASWLMLAYQMRRQGKNEPPTSAMLATIENSADASTSDYPVLNGSPLYIRQSLMFPYSQGTRFFDDVYRKLGQQAFSAVFSDPPGDSSQIIHPERYFAHVKPTTPALPSFDSGEKQKEIAAGEVGEFDNRMLLWQYVGKHDALRLAPHMRGAQFRIVESGKKKKPVLEYASEWDSDSSASDYFTAYKTVLRKKWKHCDPTRDTGEFFAGASDNGFFLTQRNGRFVSSIEGIDQQTAWRRALDRADGLPNGRGD
jgi:hypothetical protein